MLRIGDIGSGRDQIFAEPASMFHDGFDVFQRPPSELDVALSDCLASAVDGALTGDK